jgi:hypothetical protein
LRGSSLMSGSLSSFGKKVFGAPVVVKAGEEHLCVDVFPESVGSFFELFGTSSMGWRCTKL